MPRRHGHRPQRRRIFVGCEGESEVGYAAFIGLLAEEGHLPVHLDIRRCRGGDPLAIVETATSELRVRRKRHGTYATRVIFLDADRREDAPERTARADLLLREHRIHAIWSQPALEALLLKHFRGRERLEPSTTALALRQLQECWPEYRKGMPGRELRAQLDADAVVRAATMVPELKAFLLSIGLLS